MRSNCIWKWSVAAAVSAAFAVPGPAGASLRVTGGATSNVSCVHYVCTATAAAAVMNVSRLANMLTKSDVTLISGSAAQDIEFAVNMTWSGSHALTLDSWRSISIGKIVDVTGTGNLALKTNDGGSGGDLTFPVDYRKSGRRPYPGRIHFWDLSSGLTINEQSYTLVNSLSTLASLIASQPSGRYALANTISADILGTAVPTSFSGIFEGLGNGLTRSNIRTDRSGHKTGIFASIAADGTVRDLHMLSYVFVHPRAGAEIGAIAAENAGLLQNDIVMFKMSNGAPAMTVGAIAGTNAGTIRHCRGGFVVSNRQPFEHLGGIAGVNAAGGTIVDAEGNGYFAALIGGDDSDVGGIAAINHGAIDQSFSVLPVQIGNRVNGQFADAAAGGLVGLNQGGPTLGGPNMATVTNSYAVASVRGGNGTVLGGLIGASSNGSVETSYTASFVAGTPTFGGGLVGDDMASNTFTNTYWDLSNGISDPTKGAGNVPNDPGITGLTTAQLQSGLPAGFNPAIWGQAPGINGGFPYLLANPPD